MEEINSVRKQFFNKKVSSSKVTPIQLSLEKTEADVYQNFLDKKKKIKANFNLGDLCRNAGKKNNFFSKGDITNWSYKLYTITEKKKKIMTRHHLII